MLEDFTKATNTPNEPQQNQTAAQLIGIEEENEEDFDDDEIDDEDDDLNISGDDHHIDDEMDMANQEDGMSDGDIDSDPENKENDELDKNNIKKRKERMISKGAEAKSQFKQQPKKNEFVKKKTFGSSGGALSIMNPQIKITI